MNDEEYDSFPANNEDAPTFLFDPASLDIVHNNNRSSGGGGRRGGYGGGSRASRSAATTQLASDVGSTVGGRKNPFLKSITFFDPKKYYRHQRVVQKEEEKIDASQDDGLGVGEVDNSNANNNDDESDDLTCEVNDLTHWDILLRNPSTQEMQQRKSGILGKLGRKSKPNLIVEDYEGLVEFSSVLPGDRLVSINKKKIKLEEFSPEGAMEYMTKCLENEGVLHVTTENPEGQDILINVTVIKPRPEMTYEELGLIVWNWPLLCVREIRKGSIFKHTALQETDQIAAINDIDCCKMREKAFAKCVSELPTEITITLIRRKHRYTGSYV